MIKKYLSKIPEIVVALSDNAAFVGVLLTIPNINYRWLILMHLIVAVSKSYYYKDRTTVKISEQPEEQKELDIWQ